MAESLIIQVPDATRELIDRLKQKFGVKTDAEVLSRVLGLANTAVKVQQFQMAPGLASRVVFPRPPSAWAVQSESNMQQVAGFFRPIGTR